MQHTIQTTYAMQRDFILNVHDCFRLTITAHDAVGMPNEIFVYRVVPLQPAQPEAVGAYSHVCSPVDLAEFPPTQPLPNAIPPWYRLASVDILLPTRSEAVKVHGDILAAIDSLTYSLQAADILVTQPTITHGS